MKSILNFFRGLTSLLLCAVIYIVEIILLLILSIDSIFSYRTIDTLLQNIEVKEVLNNISEENNVLSKIYDSANEAGIETEAIDNLLESEEIKSLLAEYISAGTDFILRGDQNNDITVEGIVNKAKDNFNEIMNNNFNSIDEEKKQKASELIDNVADKLINALPEITDLTINTDSQTLNLIRTIFSIETIIILISIIIVLTALIGLLTYSKIKWTIYLSITTVFASLIGIAISLVPLFDFTNLLPNLPPYILVLINNGVKTICSNFVAISIIYLAISITLALIYKLYNKKQEKAKLKEQA